MTKEQFKQAKFLRNRMKRNDWSIRQSELVIERGTKSCASGSPADDFSFEKSEIAGMRLDNEMLKEAFEAL